jgi:hypothetical protein
MSVANFLLSIFKSPFYCTIGPENKKIPKQKQNDYTKGNLLAFV